MRNITILIYFIISMGGTLCAQNPLDSLVTRTIHTASKLPSELIYIQTSKDVFETGEDLWFKVYQMDARYLNLSGASQTLYLQVINEKDSIVWQEKYPVENGIVRGHVYLSKDLPHGDYFLEAYTSNSFYRDTTSLSGIRKIRVVGEISDNKITKPADSKKDFRFETYPEGGNLISGIPARLAFKATDRRGNPLDVSGTLYENGQPLTDFESRHDGMGVFVFTPLDNSDYEIRLTSGEVYDLPGIHPQGISLSLIQQNDEYVEFAVRQSPGIPHRNVYTLGTMRGIPYCGAKAVIKDSVIFKIPVKEFTARGIAEFTLFDENFRPVAERLVFVHSPKRLYITAEVDKKSYMVRNKVELKLKVTDEEGKPVSANLGVSVFDKAYAEANYPVNIETHSLLSSQIRGNIHNPYYYFNPKNEDRGEVLDLLLMTQGWRRYVQNDNEKDELKVLSDRLEGIQTIKNKKMRNTEQLIQVSGADENSTFVWADSTGYFSIEPDLLDQLRGGYIYLKPMLTKDKGPKLNIKDPFTDINDIRKNKKRYHPFIDAGRISSKLLEREPLINQFGAVLLDEVSVTAKSVRPFRDKFMGRLDSLAQRDYGPYVCEHGHLENYREGYTVHHDPRYCPCPEEPKERNPPVIGKAYRLIKPKYHGQKGGYCWFTVEHEMTIIYQGPEYTDEELLKMNNLWRTKGYYGAREFYMPDDIEMLSSLPDVRNTLLWDPLVITDEKGEASLSFRCSDINTGFVGRIEGLADDGLLGVAECEFRVMRQLQ